MRRCIAVALAAVLVGGACGSSASSAGHARSITIGLLTDLTGPAASSAESSPTGVRAGIDALAIPAGLCSATM
jgi:branched-chain amino acid transport system substrate-binding protein